MDYLYVLPGWEGFVHDAQVLQHAVYQKGFSVPSGKYYFIDASYSNLDIILVPYQGIQYHLREQALANMRPTNSKELFNLQHASLRNVIERSFGILKKRFGILLKVP